MFRLLSQITTRYRIPIIVFWVAAAVLLILFAPSLDSVATDDQSNFLPEDALSRQGVALIDQHFPQAAESANVVLVFDAGEGGDVTAEPNASFIAEVSQWLISEDAPQGIKAVQSPALVPEASALLISENQQVALVSVSMAPDLDEDGQLAVLDAARTQLDAAPEGLATYRTGQLSNSLEYSATIAENVGSTAIITIMLVTVILLLIFRSPVSPFIPLSIVTIALLVTQGIVGILGASVMTVSSIATILLIVVIYGAGTDYCLFLISRFREELESDAPNTQAATTTVQRIGESIFNSAATTTTGFMAMAFTQFGLFNTTGPILAIAIVVTLLASMTLTPALLSLAGKHVFFPIKLATQRETPRFYVALSRFIKRYPARITLVLGTLGLALSIYGLGYGVTFDFLADMPAENESVAGYRVLEDELGPGNVQPVSVVAEVDHDVYAASADLTQQILAVDGVVDVRSATQPLGSNHQTANITRVDAQLRTLSAFTAPLDRAPTDEERSMMANLIAALPAYLDQLAALDPTIVDDPAYDATLTAIDESSVMPQFQTLSDGLGGLADVVAPVHVSLAELSPAITAFFGGDLVTGLSAGYTGAEAVRFEIILADGPYTTAAMDTVEAIRDVLASNSATYGTAGGTATTLDLRLIMDSDLQLTIFLVLGGIFVILVLMLRSLVAPVYLIGTIALSFGTTLGLTRLASGTLFGEERFVFWVPFMIFVFLVALGIDYSIFLFSRIKEELKKDGDITESIFRSVGSTASIIASAGMIVSGSFIALTTADIVGLQQVGFAVGGGILIDTIVIRTILVPSIALLFGNWSWFPGPLFRRNQPTPRIDLAQQGAD